MRGRGGRWVLIPLLSVFFPWGGNILAIPCASPPCHTLCTPYRDNGCKVSGCGEAWVASNSSHSPFFSFVFCFVFSLTLFPFSCTLRALGVLWFVGRGSCLYACVCMRGPFGALLRNINILGFHLCICSGGGVGVWALNILLHQTIVSPWSVAIPYPLLFFFPCFALTLSLSSCTSRALGVY